MLRVACCVLRTECCVLRYTCCVLCVACCVVLAISCCCVMSAAYYVLRTHTACSVLVNATYTMNLIKQTADVFDQTLNKQRSNCYPSLSIQTVTEPNETEIRFSLVVSFSHFVKINPIPWLHHPPSPIYLFFSLPYFTIHEMNNLVVLTNNLFDAKLT